jgi:mono/diheme cytochrome c family protein
MNKFSLVSVCILLAASATFASAQKSGADVYKASCAMCHGSSGDAATPAGKMFKAASFSAPDVMKASDADMLAIIKKGKDKMPAWDGVLTNDQMKDVIAHIHTLQGEKSPSGGSMPDPAQPGSEKSQSSCINNVD